MAAYFRPGSFRLQILGQTTISQRMEGLECNVITSMLYQVHMLGKSAVLSDEIRAWAASATSKAVLSLVSWVADNVNFFSAPPPVIVWLVVADLHTMITCCYGKMVVSRRLLANRAGGARSVTLF